MVNSFRAHHWEVNRIKTWMFFHQFTFHRAKGRHIRAGTRKGTWLSLLYAAHNFEVAVKIQANTEKSWITVWCLFFNPTSLPFKSSLNCSYPITLKEFLFFFFFNYPYTKRQKTRLKTLEMWNKGNQELQGLIHYWLLIRQVHSVTGSLFCVGLR